MIEAARELSERFGEDVADALVSAYAVALETGPLSYEQRLAISTALIEEVEAGHIDRSYLKDVALIFAPPRVEGRPASILEER